MTGLPLATAHHETAPMVSMQRVTLIGYGAIGRTLIARMAGHPSVRITHVVVSESRVADCASRTR